MSHERKETGSAFCEREFTLLSSEANRESWPCGNEANVFLNSKIPLHRETILEFQYPWIDFHPCFVAHRNGLPPVRLADYLSQRVSQNKKNLSQRATYRRPPLHPPLQNLSYILNLQLGKKKVISYDAPRNLKTGI